jgi:hypothetical protein
MLNRPISARRRSRRARVRDLEGLDETAWNRVRAANLLKTSAIARCTTRIKDGGLESPADRVRKILEGVCRDETWTMRDKAVHHDRPRKCGTRASGSQTGRRGPADRKPDLNLFCERLPITAPCSSTVSKSPRLRASHRHSALETRLTPSNQRS